MIFGLKIPPFSLINRFQFLFDFMHYFITVSTFINRIYFLVQYM
ncbi:hypothetical protein [Salmonella phage SD-1_S14]|nr:hypothetical protein [Salmonella phage SD-1_S14]